MVAECQCLRICEDGELVWVTLDRQQDRNSLDSEIIAHLRRHLEATEMSRARAVIYQGAGETYFIGGADGVEMFEMTPAKAHGFSLQIQALFTRMEESPLLLVAAIDGLCFGGGLEFALSCDLRFASDRSRLGLPETKLGIIPGGGGTQRLRRVVGFGRAVEMTLTGCLIDANEALKAGLVHDVVPAGDLAVRAGAAAERAKAIPPHAFAAAKRTIYTSRGMRMADGLRVEAEAFAGCFSEAYFADRVREQLADGRLSTTRNVPGRREVGSDGNVSVE